MRAGWHLSVLSALLLTALPALAHNGLSKKDNDAGGRAGPDRQCTHSEHCGHWHKKHKHAHDRMGHHRHMHGSRSSGFGSLASAACGASQGACSSSSASGMRSLAQALGAAAADLNKQSQELKDIQKEIVQDTLTQNPGPTNPESQQFDASTQSGASRRSDFNATDPSVKSAVEKYNEIGDTMDELDAEAKKYEEQQAEMNQMADKNSMNANNLESKNSSVSGTQAGAGGPGKTRSTIASAKAGSKDADGADSSITVAPVAGLESGKQDPKAAYPDKKASELGKVSGAGVTVNSAAAFAAKNSALRDSIREKLNNTSGSSRPSAPQASEPGVASGAGATFAGGEGSAEEKKVARPSIDAANTEESVTPFGKQLSGAKIALAGSETDASVKQLLNDFGVDKEAGRGPASQSSPEIGSQDGPSLFERTHATHKRCAKSGCVTLAGKERTGG